MSIISVIKRRFLNVIGDRSITTGTYDISASGEINTGLGICEFLGMQGTGTITGSVSVVNVDSFPRSGSSIPVVTNTHGGIWFAYGK
jgi:hypothetical protein